MYLKGFENGDGNLVIPISIIEDIKKIDPSLFKYFYGTGCILNTESRGYRDINSYISIFPKENKGYIVSIYCDGPKKINKRYREVRDKILNAISKIEEFHTILIKNDFRPYCKSSTKMSENPNSSIIEIDKEINPKNIINLFQELEKTTFFITPKIKAVSFDVPRQEKEKYLIKQNV